MNDFHLAPDLCRWTRRQGLAIGLRAALAGLWVGVLVGLPAAPAVALADEAKPKVVLDHLDFPERLGGHRYKKHLERRLKREARSVDWGASSDSTIEYRFAVTRLAVTQKGKALTVSCAAIGHLPRGRSAASRLSFSGRPSERDQLVKHVLDIVARGVMARLAELERVRRGKDSDRRVPQAD